MRAWSTQRHSTSPSYYQTLILTHVPTIVLALAITKPESLHTCSLSSDQGTTLVHRAAYCGHAAALKLLVTKASSGGGLVPPGAHGAIATAGHRCAGHMRTITMSYHLVISPTGPSLPLDTDRQAICVLSNLIMSYYHVK